MYHCTVCHGTFEPGDGPTWEYDTDGAVLAGVEVKYVLGFGLCADDNTESYGSAAWAYSVGAIEEGDLACTYGCEVADEKVFGPRS